MQTRKHTAWKKNRRFGEIHGGRQRLKCADGIFNRLHSFLPPDEGQDTPIFIVDNPSRDFYFPITPEDIQTVLRQLPNEHTEHLTHIWLQKVKTAEYKNGETIQGMFICGSKVNLIVLHPFPTDLKMRLGKEKPLKKILNFYKHYCIDVKHDKDGWFLLWTPENIRKYYLESLLLHEIGHSIDSFYMRFWSKAADSKQEEFANQYAYIWADTVRLIYKPAVVK